MSAMDPEQAYLAVLAFLEEQWERTGRPDELAMFLGPGQYTPGEGTSDPAMWWDWLAAIKQVQTGIVTPDHRWLSLKPEDMARMSAEQAYLAMVQYIDDYWKRVNRPAEMGELLRLMRYTPGSGTADPSMWQSWLAVIDRVRRSQERRSGPR